MVLLFFGDHAETAAQNVRLDSFAILSDHEPTHGAAIGRLADDPKARVIARHDYSAGRLVNPGLGPSPGDTESKYQRDRCDEGYEP